MKKSAILITAILVLAMIFGSTVCAFAAEDLKIVKTNPEDGANNLQPQNIAIKYTFNQDMMDEAAIEANQDLFEVIGPDGTSYEYSLVYNEKKHPDQLWVVLSNDTTLESTKTYTVTAKAGIVSAEGSTLAEDYVTEFTIRNTKTDSTLNWVMMAGMMVIMFGATFFAAKKAANADENGEPVAKPVKMNPYKMAKEQGISVEEAKAQIAKEMEKQAKKQAKLEAERKKKEEAKAAEIERLRAEQEAIHKANTYHVKTKRIVKRP